MSTNGVSRPRHARAPDALTLRFPGDPAELASARHAVREHLTERGVPRDVIADLELVTSELVTNGIMHGRPGWISVEVELDVNETVVIRVTNEGPSALIPPVEDWQPVSGLAISGRGLGIVRQLVDHAAVTGDEKAATVACSRVASRSGWMGASA